MSFSEEETSNQSKLLQNLEASKARLSTKIESINTKLVKKEEELKQLKLINLSIQEQAMKESTALVKRQKEQLTTLSSDQKDYKHLQETLRNNEIRMNQLEHAEAERNTLSFTANNLEESITKLQEQIKVFESEKLTVKNQLKSKDDELRGYKRKSLLLEYDMKDLNTKLEKLQKENQQLQEEIARPRSASFDSMESMHFGSITDPEHDAKMDDFNKNMEQLSSGPPSLSLSVNEEVSDKVSTPIRDTSVYVESEPMISVLPAQPSMYLTSENKRLQKALDDALGKQQALEEERVQERSLFAGEKKKAQEQTYALQQNIQTLKTAQADDQYEKDNLKSEVKKVLDEKHKLENDLTMQKKSSEKNITELRGAWEKENKDKLDSQLTLRHLTDKTDDLEAMTRKNDALKHRQQDMLNTLDLFVKDLRGCLETGSQPTLDELLTHHFSPFRDQAEGGKFGE